MWRWNSGSSERAPPSPAEMTPAPPTSSRGRGGATSSTPVRGASPPSRNSRVTRTSAGRPDGKAVPPLHAVEAGISPPFHPPDVPPVEPGVLPSRRPRRAAHPRSRRPGDELPPNGTPRRNLRHEVQTSGQCIPAGRWGLRVHVGYGILPRSRLVLPGGRPPPRQGRRNGEYGAHDRGARRSARIWSHETRCFMVFTRRDNRAYSSPLRESFPTSTRAATASSTDPSK